MENSVVDYDLLILRGYPNRMSLMLLGIWLVLYWQVPYLKSIGRGALVNANGFTRDSIHECGETSIGNKNRISKREILRCITWKILGANFRPWAKLRGFIFLLGEYFVS